jgi:signal transduction histidine kinase
MIYSFSAIAGWLVYYDLHGKKVKLFSLSENVPDPHTHAQKAYLESEEFLKFSIPEIGWRQLCLDDGSHACIGRLSTQDCNLPNYILLWRDRPLSITEEKKFEAEITFLNCTISLEQKYSCQQMQTEQLQHIVRRIEHQLRNPLALINLYTENLYRSLSNAQEQAQVAAIRDAIHHLTSHLSELVQCSSQSHLRIAFCDIGRVFEDSLQGLELLVQEKGIQVHHPSTSLQIMADCAQIKQVFDNLLHNALCFSPPRSHLYCHWQGFQQEILITIADQGPGLSEADIQQMFQPYYSKRLDGTGLGLAIAQKIVLEHGGKLWADNLAQGGAQFSISLPRYASHGFNEQSEHPTISMLTSLNHNGA